MSGTLETYLHDHLSGSHVATKLLNSLQEQYNEEPLGTFAGAMLAEVTQDQEILESIIRQVGTAHLGLAESIGWLFERVSQIKLHRDGDRAGLGTFQALEILTLGIRGKMALWRALAAIGLIDARIPAYDFDHLASRAKNQFARTEEQRLKLVASAFQPPPA